MVTAVRAKFSAGHFTPIEPLSSEALQPAGLRFDGAVGG
jgi:hypothetical protein